MQTPFYKLVDALTHCDHAAGFPVHGCVLFLMGMSFILFPCANIFAYFFFNTVISL